jgi:hypothetical protein
VRVVFNRARGNRSGKFTAQDGAKARAAKKFEAAAFSRARWRIARALPRGKPPASFSAGC